MWRMKNNNPGKNPRKHAALSINDSDGIQTLPALTVGNGRRLAGDYDDEGVTFYSRSLTGRLRPREKRVRIKGSKEFTSRLETQQEVEDRVQRMEGYEERSKTRKRWKKRTVNFQLEEDVGNTFLAKAEQSLGEKLRAREQQRRVEKRKARKARRKAQEKEERKRLREREQNDDLEEDDEVKEQSQLLAQLTQQSDAMPEEEDEDSIEPDGAPSSMILPEELNYWERGYSIPQPSFALTLITNANATFRPGYRSGHIHHMLNMAARSLCGGGGGFDDSMGEIGLENDYLRLLCTREGDSSMKSDAGPSTDPTICANVRTRGYLTIASEEQGKNMLLYLQNSWDDPVNVARHLGILDCYQDSPIKGNLLSSIRLHSTNIRSKVKKSHKVRSMDWNHEDIDVQPDHDHDEDSINATDDKAAPEITTSGGVADTMTMESALTVDKNRALRPSNDAHDALISPNNLYSHIAGTSPPIPQHPLDPSSCLFGPVDRHSKFYHGSVKMDSSIYRVMLSTLMKRVGVARTVKKESVSAKAQKQILELIEEFADINENKLYLRYTNYVQDPSDSDIPLVEFYRGVAGYCSFMANGYLEMERLNAPHDSHDAHGAYHEHEDLEQASGMTLLAEKIWEFCRPKIRRNALVRFPKIRITYGLALICRSLPPSAAEILSRPTDSDGLCSPLDLFKETLEELECKNSITCTSKRHFEDNSTIRAVELEFLLHDAAELFQEAVKLDSINVDYQLWHIGCLASCLLISSGNRISDNVHAYPSQKKGNFLHNENADHEVRHRLKKYHEVRVELSAAVRALLTLAKYQNSARAHCAVYSLLEWGQVIGLLVGQSLGEHLEEVKSLHTFHFRQWARCDPSAFLREYQGRGKNAHDASIYAQMLENDPGDVDNWRKFVRCLGPVVRRKIDDSEWWGKDRSWWRTDLLHIFTTNETNRVMENEGSRAVKAVLACLGEATKFSSILTNNSLEPNGTGDENEASVDCLSFGWLPTRNSISSQNNENAEVLKEVRSKCYADDLPRKNKRMIVPKSDESDVGSSNPMSSPGALPLPDLSSASQEVQAYKIFISCHLFGPEHPSIREYIYCNLFRNCFSNENSEKVDKNCDEFRTLVWFVSLGIDMIELMRDKY
eukprot:jgi/Psemu1/328221/estExt_fgenesh1_pg.C_10980001